MEFLSLLTMMIVGAIVGVGAFFAGRQVRFLLLKILLGIVAAIIFGFGVFYVVVVVIFATTRYGELSIGGGAVAGLAAFGSTLLLVLARVPKSDAKTARSPRPTAQQATAATPTASPARPFAPPDVFISYKRDERPEVEEIAKRLQDLGVSVWFDAELNSGISFDAEIDRNIREAKCVLVCWSPSAVASEWVRGEATIGRQRGVLAASMLKPSDLPAPFNLIHAEDLTAGSGAHNPAWLRLLGRVGDLIGRPGLAGFAAISESRDKAAISAWLAEHPHDPLFDRAVAMLKVG